MQAGARKKELLERLGGQVAPQTNTMQTQSTPTQPSANLPTLSATPNGVKSCLQNLSLEQKQHVQNPQRHCPQFQSPNTDATAPPEEKITLIQKQNSALRKRKVMQRVNTGSIVSPQIPPKLRVVKRLTPVSTHYQLTAQCVSFHPLST